MCATSLDEALAWLEFAAHEPQQLRSTADGRGKKDPGWLNDTPPASLVVGAIAGSAPNHADLVVRDVVKPCLNVTCLGESDCDVDPACETLPGSSAPLDSINSCDPPHMRCCHVCSDASPLTELLFDARDSS